MKRILHIAKPAFSLLLVMFTFLLLSSCTSFSNLVRSQVEGIPSWVYTPNVRSNQTAFVGKGSATLAFNSRLIAYEDILSQISSYVGENVRDTYYRELTTTDAIQDLNLTITNEHIKEDPRSPVETFLLASSDTAKLDSKRSSVLNAILERDKIITDLLAQADSAYRANDDGKAINLYLEAALISSEGPVSARKHEVENLLEKATSFISSLRFSLFKPNDTNATTTVYLRRRSRLLSPKVLNAPIIAQFEARNSLGRTYTDSLFFNTSNKGFIDFIPYNQGLVSSGSIVFTVDFSASMEKLEAALPFEQVRALKEAIELCMISFPYTLVSPYKNAVLVADIHEYDTMGSLLPTKNALPSLIDEYAMDSLTVRPITLISEDPEDMFVELAQKTLNPSLLIVGRVGVVKQVNIGDKFTVVVSGSVQLWDPKQESIITDTKEVEAVAFASTLAEAQQEAFVRFGMIAAALSFPYLY